MNDTTDARLAAEVTRGATLLATGERLLAVHARVLGGEQLDRIEKALVAETLAFDKANPHIVPLLIGNSKRLLDQPGGPTDRDLADLSRLLADEPAAAKIRADIAALAGLDEAVDPDTDTPN